MQARVSPLVQNLYRPNQIKVQAAFILYFRLSDSGWMETASVPRTLPAARPKAVGSTTVKAQVLARTVVMGFPGRRDGCTMLVVFEVLDK